MKIIENLFSRSYNKAKVYRIIGIIIGFFSFLWFLIRVIPKPHRATYPCMRATYPFTTAFILWLLGIFTSKQLYNQAGKYFKQKKLILSISVACLALFVFLLTLFVPQTLDTMANTVSYVEINQGARKIQATFESNSVIDTIPQAVVAVVQSGQTNASLIKQDEITAMVRKAIELSGGFDKLIQSGDTIVLKPNVIGATDESVGGYMAYPQEANGVSTDYRLIQSVVNIIRDLNRNNYIVLLEASGFGVTRENINLLGYNKIASLDSVILLDEFKGEWFDSTASDLVAVELPEEIQRCNSHSEYYLNNIYKKAQVLISLPTLKTHFLTGTTGAIKNVAIGATPVRIYGNGPTFNREDMAGRWRVIKHWDDKGISPLDDFIHDYYLCRPVDFVITDGLQGAQYGPYPGCRNDGRLLEEVQMNMRLVLAGSNPMAVDAIHSLIIGVDPYKVSHMRMLSETGQGCINPSKIQVVGKPVHELKKAFKEHEPGSFSQYTDFEAPEVTVKLVAREKNQLKMEVIANKNLAKIEVITAEKQYNYYLNSSSMQHLLLIPVFKGKEKIKIKVYDRLLNCSEYELTS